MKVTSKMVLDMVAAISPLAMQNSSSETGPKETSPLRSAGTNQTEKSLSSEKMTLRSTKEAGRRKSSMGKASSITKMLVT